MDPLLEFPDTHDQLELYSKPPATKRKKGVAGRTVVCNDQKCILKKNNMRKPQIGMGLGVGGLNPQDLPIALPMGAMKVAKRQKRYARKSGRGRKKTQSGRGRRGKGRKQRKWKKRVKKRGRPRRAVRKSRRRVVRRRRAVRRKRGRPARRRKRQTGRGRVKKQVGGSKRRRAVPKKSVAKRAPIRASAKSVHSCRSQKPIKY